MKLLLLLLFKTFSFAGSIIFHTPIQGTRKKKLFGYFIYKEKMPALAGMKHLSFLFFPRKLHLFHLSTENGRAISVRNGHESALSRAETMNYRINNRSKRFFIKIAEYLKKAANGKHLQVEFTGGNRPVHPRKEINTTDMNYYQLFAN